MGWNRTFFWILLLFLAVLAACRSAVDRPVSLASRDDPGTTPAVLTDLDRIDQLRDQFNEDAGKPRLLLILAPL